MYLSQRNYFVLSNNNPPRPPQQRGGQGEEVTKHFTNQHTFTQR
jgi:hypothetical protein